MDPANNTPIVILKDVESDLMLPIWVGPFEANSIASEIEKVTTPRPMTHDLLRNIIVEFGGEVIRVVVTELRDNTFYAVIEIEFQGKKVLIDARPSDAIALALRADCPIFVRDEVVAISQQNEASSGGADSDEDDDFEWPEELDNVSDYKM
jgi:hypothetical protein